MNFEKSLRIGFKSSARIAGSDFIIDGQTVRGILDELEMVADRETFGDVEEATAEIVFASNGFPIDPAQKMVIRRLSDSVRFKVLTFDRSTEHITLKVKRLGKQSRGE